MDVFLIILAGFFVLTGLLGSVLPVLPGPPLSYIGLLLLHFTDKYQFSMSFLLWWLAVVVVVQVLDYVIPIWGTKKFGGSKNGVWGSTIGLVVGLFLGPFGIILGPFAGAFVGEMLANKDVKTALKAAFGSFVGFLLGTVAKLVVSGFAIYYYVHTLVG
ncbi:MAG: rane protein [Bacteroidetes bacterium]|jgi:uncharacterized protein YqgC (DUF456 family)|nr:rane protein [Bacteroidota bacterium]